MSTVNPQMPLFQSPSHSVGIVAGNDRRLALLLTDWAWLDMLADEWWPLRDRDGVSLGVGSPRGTAVPDATHVIAWIDPDLLPQLVVRVFRAGNWIEASVRNIDPADEEVIWPGPIPLFAVLSFSVATEADRLRVLALAKGFSNVATPVQPVRVEPVAVLTSKSEAVSVPRDAQLSPPAVWNAARGAAAMALWSVPSLEPWMSLLCASLSLTPAEGRGIEVESPWWNICPWSNRDNTARTTHASALWQASISVLSDPSLKDTWRPAEILATILGQAVSLGADRELTRGLDEESRAILRDERSVDVSRSRVDPVGLTIQLVLLRPSPNRFADWAKDLHKLPLAVWWSGAALSGLITGYRDLEPRFRVPLAARRLFAIRTWQLLHGTKDVWSEFTSSPAVRRRSDGLEIVWDGIVCVERHETNRSAWFDSDLKDVDLRRRAVETAKVFAPQCVQRFLQLNDASFEVEGDGQLAVRDVEGARRLEVAGAVRIWLPSGTVMADDLNEHAFRRWLLLDGIDGQLPPPRALASPQPALSPGSTVLDSFAVVTDSDVPGLQFVMDFVSEAEERTLLQAIDALPWSNELQRRVQHYGWRYDYKAKAVDLNSRIAPLPSWAEQLARKLLDKGLLPEMPDQLIVNEYVGRQGISKHTDLPFFRGPIAMISLGEAWEMNFWPPRGPKIPRLLPLRSLTVLTGPAREKWKHEIPVRKSESWGERGRRVSLTFRKVDVRETGQPAKQAATVTTSAGTPERSFIYRMAQMEMTTMRSKAYRMAEPVEPSERLIVMAPHGTDLGGLEFSGEELVRTMRNLNGIDELDSPLFQGEHKNLAGGILRQAGGNLFAIGLDGSLALRRRLYHDRHGEGARVARGDIGLFTSLEQVLLMFRYARALVKHAPHRVDQWSFRHELHGIKGRHLMDDPPGGRRGGAMWNVSKPSSDEVVRIAGEIDLCASAAVIGQVLDELATRLAYTFDCERVVSRMRPGSETIESLRSRP